MTLLQNHIIVTPLPAPDKTAGGIYIPANLVKPRNRGTITHIGTNVNTDLLGKEILFQLPAAQKIKFENIEGLLMFTTDIIATLN